MEFRQLRYFITVADTLNFSRAAESLYISQSGLSQQIADLEQEIGVNLLKRSKRSVELTEAGKTMQRLARQLLNQADKLVPEVRYIAQTESYDRDIYIGLDHSVDMSHHAHFRLLLTDVIFQTKQEMPGLRPTFEIMEHEQLSRALEVGTVDLGFFLHHNTTVGFSDKLAVQLLRHEEMVLVIRSDTDIEDTPENLRDVLMTKGLILLERETKGMGQALRMLDSVGAEPYIRFCENRSVMMLTAESGECATLLPMSVVRGMHNPSMKILHFHTPSASRYLLAVWRRDNHNSLIPIVLQKLTEKLHVN